MNNTGSFYLCADHMRQYDSIHLLEIETAVMHFKAWIATYSLCNLFNQLSVLEKAQQLWWDRVQ